MKRCKDLEYSWAGLKAGLTVNAYTVECDNGKKYVVYAHDFNDQSWFLARLDFRHGVSQRSRDCETHFEQRPRTSYLPDKKGQPKKKPFWYRGRGYELKGVQHE
ncbi:MAG: hypothetical protein GX117_05000 [Candidatus Hydrogenedentes bacterium]|nr:hypothetical protein [Candidatus Hydrogenedentota bacterium]